MRIPPEFEKILILLHEAEINYVLIGGLAMILQGGNHVTDDTDISVALDTENAQKVCDWLISHHAKPPLYTSFTPFAITPETLRKFRFLNLKTDLGAIDVLPIPAGIESFEELLERANLIELDGFAVHVASIDDLIAMKKAANRPKDQLHLMELQALKKLIEEENLPSTSG